MMNRSLLTNLFSTGIEALSEAALLVPQSSSATSFDSKQKGKISKKTCKQIDGSVTTK